MKKIVVLMLMGAGLFAVGMNHDGPYINEKHKEGKVYSMKKGGYRY